MTTVDSSWQTSVVQLAQAGNVKAIAFWLNRDLVPKGICAQVLAEQPGRLLIRMVSHQLPKRERLTAFVCHRLRELQIASLQAAHVCVYKVNTQDLMWEETVTVTPTAAPKSAPAVASAKTPNPPSDRRSGSAPASAPPPAPTPDTVAAEIRQAIARATPPAPASPAPSPAKAAAPVAPPLISPSGLPYVVQIPDVAPVASTPAAPRPVRKKLKRPRSLVGWWRWSKRQTVEWAHSARQSSSHGVDWLLTQTTPVQVATLSGSAIAVLLIGCGFEMVRQYTIDPSFGRNPELAAHRSASERRAGSVRTPQGQVPVIQATVADPTTPIRLVFSNSATLSPAPSGATNEAQLSAAPSGGITAFQQADLSMTSLTDPLLLQQVFSSSNTQSSAPLSANPIAVTAESDVPADAVRPDGTVSDGTVPDDTVSDDTVSDGTALNNPGSDRPVPAVVPPLDSDYPEPPEAIAPATRMGHRTGTTVQDLLANGVDIVNVTPEAIGTTGDEATSTAALTQTLDVLRQRQIYAIGAGQASEASHPPQIFEVKGQRIAYLGYADPSLSDQLATVAGLAPTSTEQLTADIQAIRDQVDWVVVNFQWQRHLRAYPEAWQTRLARHAIDQGADLVVGYHPYLTQGAEIYQGRAIVYSLGRSLDEFDEYIDEYGQYVDESALADGGYGDSDAAYDANGELISSDASPDRSTVALQVTIQEQQFQLNFLPLQVQNGRATLAEGEVGEEILRSFQQASSFFDQPIQIPTHLDQRLRVSLPAAEGDLPATDPFITIPESKQ